MAAQPFWSVVNEVIRRSDILLIVLDARFWEKTRNRELEEKIKRDKKKYIYVLNKSDLLNEVVENIRLPLKHFVFVSAKENLGTTLLRQKLKKLSHKRPLHIGVVGYPNTGKSSLINTLLQRKAAPTSSTPGFTKGLQKLRFLVGVYLLDTPGVIPYGEDAELMHSLINVKDVNHIKDADVVAVEIIKYFLAEAPSHLKDCYGIEIVDDANQMFERIAQRLNILKKGGDLDLDKAARKIIMDWQRGKLK